MPETKATCQECGDEIQLWTAERTGGLGMPRKIRSPRIAAKIGTEAKTVAKLAESMVRGASSRLRHCLARTESMRSSGWAI
jgi:hypothetical protein